MNLVIQVEKIVLIFNIEPLKDYLFHLLIIFLACYLLAGFLPCSSLFSWKFRSQKGLDKESRYSSKQSSDSDDYQHAKNLKASDFRVAISDQIGSLP
jgi:hypothetical protein